MLVLGQAHYNTPVHQQSLAAQTTSSPAPSQGSTMLSLLLKAMAVHAAVCLRFEETEEGISVLMGAHDDEYSPKHCSYFELKEIMAMSYFLCLQLVFVNSK